MGFDDIFLRKWEYYFCYCEAAFATRTLNNLHLVLSRPGNKSLMSKPTLGSPPGRGLRNSYPLLGELYDMSAVALAKAEGRGGLSSSNFAFEP